MLRSDAVYGHDLPAWAIVHFEEFSPPQQSYLREMMSHKTEKIKRPRHPDHGMATQRWLRGDYRQQASGGKAAIVDVFEIDCLVCGKYELRVARPVK